jgi:hypothetical protein
MVEFLSRRRAPVPFARAQPPSPSGYPALKHIILRYILLGQAFVEKAFSLKKPGYFMKNFKTYQIFRRPLNTDLRNKAELKVKRL